MTTKAIEAQLINIHNQLYDLRRAHFLLDADIHDQMTHLEDIQREVDGRVLPRLNKITSVLDRWPLKYLWA